MGNTTRRPKEEELAEFEENYEKHCKDAAKAIANSTFFLLATGAGFSADSGLAVYKDVASIPAYQEKQLGYSQICDPKWIKDDPSLFFGFWGACFNGILISSN